MGEFTVVTGLKPYVKIDIGAKKIMDLAVYFQKRGGMVNYVLADMEAYLVNKIDFDRSLKIGLDHILDLYALGFDLKKSRLYFQSENESVKNLAYKLSRYVNSNTLKSLYDKSGIQLQISALMEVSDLLLPKIEYPERPTIVCLGKDQMPYFYLARELARKSGCDMPSVIFFNSKQMVFSNSKLPSIYFDEEIEKLSEKVKKFVTGGQVNARDHRRYGGNPDDCNLYELILYLSKDSREILNIREECKKGIRLCKDCKEEAILKLKGFIEKHKKEKSKIKSKKSLSRLLSTNTPKA